MAFSKAKILRFNDIKSCAPPPGAYNPKYEDHVAGITISSRNKLQEYSSPSTTCSDTKSLHSNSSAPVFRTPTVPCRKKVLHSINSLGKKCSSVKLFSPKQTEALREKIVECKNKDETIKELDNQLDDLKLEIRKLRVEIDALLLERDELIQRLENKKSEYENDLINIKEQYNKDIENINGQLSQSLTDNKNITEAFKQMKAELRAKNASEMKQLQDNLILLEKHLKENLQETENILKETEEKLADKESSCCNMQKELLRKCEELRDLEEKYNESLITQVELQRSHATELESVKKMHRTEIEDIDYEMLKVVTEWRNVVKKLECDHAKEMTVTQTQQNFEIKALKSECEKRVNEMEERMNVIREEVEQHWNWKLQEEVKNYERERNEAREQMEHEIGLRRAEVSRYEVTLQKTRATMDALKRRLLESDSDVEQLKEQLAQLGRSQINFELVETRVLDVEKQLLARVDELQVRADTEIARLNSVVNEKQCTITDLSTYIHNQQRLHFDAQALVGDAKVQLERLEMDRTDLEFKVARLETASERARIEVAKLTTENETLRESGNELLELRRKYEQLTVRNQELEETVATQNALIEPLREQLEMHEREREQLVADKKEAEDEARATGLKLAEMIGHQNYKQRLHHVVDLKKECLDLREIKKEYEAKVQQQGRTIERLRQELAQLSRPTHLRSPALLTDKENVSAAKQLATSARFSSPLRERN